MSLNNKKPIIFSDSLRVEEYSAYKLVVIHFKSSDGEHSFAIPEFLGMNLVKKLEELLYDPNSDISPEETAQESSDKRDHGRGFDL